MQRQHPGFCNQLIRLLRLLGSYKPHRHRRDKLLYDLVLFLFSNNYHGIARQPLLPFGCIRLAKSLLHLLVNHLLVQFPHVILQLQQVDLVQGVSLTWHFVF